MGLTLENAHVQKLSPKTLQYITLLQMNSMELAEHIDSLITENPAIELDEPRAERDEWEKLHWLSSAPQRRAQSSPDDEKSHGEAGYVHEESLFDALREQIYSSAADYETKRCALILAASLNGRGYLDEGSYEQLARQTGQAAAVRALELLQSCSPAGVGAMTLSECLLLQLRREGEGDSLAAKIAESYLEKMANAHYHMIAAALGAELEQVYEASARIKELTPHPGMHFAAREQVAYIYPDFYVDEALAVHLCSAQSPELKLSPYYDELSRSSEDEQVRKYLDDKLRQARWVINSINQRNSTLIRCVTEMVKIQKDFFSSADGALRPMRQADVAQALGFHESTVSRAIRGKYLYCKRGLFPLSHFFTVSTASISGEEGISASSVKQWIAEIIAAEDRSRPLSDESIARMLAEEGLQISRRTVAKYRTELHIANTSARRAHYRT